MRLALCGENTACQLACESLWHCSSAVILVGHSRVVTANMEISVVLSDFQE